MLSRTLALFGCALCVASALGTEQAAGVRGKLVCSGQPATNVKVKLYDVDTIDPDDLLAEGVTDEQGNFELSGYTSEITRIDPKVNVYNSCNKGIIPCPKKIAIKIPEEYITEGQQATKLFDIGTLNLNGDFSGAHYDCIN